MDEKEEEKRIDKGKKMEREEAKERKEHTTKE